MSSPLALLVAAAFVLGAACAPTKLKPLPENPPRIPDSMPERSAATRNAAGQQFHLEQEDRFWGIEEDKELKRQAQEKKEEEKQKEADRVVIPMPRIGADGGAPEPERKAPIRK